MKILQYTLGLPPFRRGGLPRYSTDLSKELSKDNEVYLMYPGQINPFSHKIKLSKKKSKYSFQIIEMKNPLPVSLGLGIEDDNYYMQKRDITALKKLVKDIKPDVVHLHTLMGLPKEFLGYLQINKIKTVYTTHDFYGLCPKMLKKNPKKELKTPECTYDCMLCNVGPSYGKILIMQSHLYARLKDSKIVKKLRSKNKSDLSYQGNSVLFSNEQINKRYDLRKYYLNMFSFIDLFHFNSSVSKEYFQQYFSNIQGKVIPITHDNLIDDRENSSLEVNTPIHLGYIGPYDEKKGFYAYTQVLKKLNVKNKFEAHFYGDIIDKPIFQQNYCVNHGILSENRLNKEYDNLDLLVVPSLWHETFGYIVLEALLKGVPCLVSSNVGAKDLLPKNWIFNSKGELKNLLEKLINNPDRIRQMKLEVSKLSLDYKLDKHASDVITELYN